MTQDRFDRINNGLDNLMDSDITRGILIGAAVLAVLYFSGYVMQIITTVVIAFKQLSSAIKKPA